MNQRTWPLDKESFSSVELGRPEFKIKEEAMVHGK